MSQPISQSQAVPPEAARAFGVHLMAKPVGPVCNLRCKYCFYLEKKALFPEREPYRMRPEVLEAYIRRCAEANQHVPTGILFAWQGGEPTLLGVDFFRKAVALEKKYCGGRPFQNTLQTNGTLLTDEWCEFLAENNFLIGLSLDGPEAIHDFYRVDARGRPTFARVLRGLKLLQKHGVEYNILACVARETSRRPLAIYHFFREQGVEFIQFLPIVERLPDEAARRMGLSLGTPPGGEATGEVTPWSVEPDAFGDFYIRIFDEWVRRDVGKRFVMNFEWTLFNARGGDGAVCYQRRRCGDACIVEHNGDIYACDHYVYPEFKLGNVLADDVRALAESERQREWGARKERILPKACRACEVAALCRGGCPKHRFAHAGSGEPGRNYLCAGYWKFYRHAAKYLRIFKALLDMDLPCEMIMRAIDQPLVIPASAKTNGKPLVLWVNNHSDQWPGIPAG